MAFEITHPAPNQTVKVRLGQPPANCNCAGGASGSGMGAGYICAKGIATGVSGAVPGTVVYGKILAPGTPNPTNPTPDACTAQGTIDEFGDWIISLAAVAPALRQDIPCARCGPAANPQSNKVFCWAVYNDGSKQADAVDPFYGVCGNKTECDAAGAQNILIAAATLPGTAPRVWNLQTEGFGKGKTKFNAGYVLTLSAESQVWVNEGDGEKKVRAELSYDPARAIEWQLVLRLRKTSVVYYQTSQNWSWTKGNDLLFTGGDPEKKGVPPKVQVTVQ